MPQLREVVDGVSGTLAFFTAIAPYDVLPWVGDRCHELRTLVLTTWLADGVKSRSPRMHTSQRKISPLSASTLPKLDVLIFLTLPHLPLSSTHTCPPQSEEDIRTLSFALLPSYLVRSTPSLLYPRSLHHEWLEEDP